MKKILIIFFLLIIIGIGGFVGYYLLHPTTKLTDVQKHQALEKLLGRGLRTPKKERTENQQYHGRYVSFAYPPTAEIYVSKQNSKSPNGLETFQFQNRETHSFFTADVSKA